MRIDLRLKLPHGQVRRILQDPDATPEELRWAFKAHGDVETCQKLEEHPNTPLDVLRQIHIKAMRPFQGHGQAWDYVVTLHHHPNITADYIHEWRVRAEGNKREPVLAQVWKQADIRTLRWWWKMEHAAAQAIGKPFFADPRVTLDLLVEIAETDAVNRDKALTEIENRGILGLLGG